MPSGEDRLIARFFRPLARDPAALDLADDAAVITPPPGADLVLTTDGVIEGVHFFPGDPADAIAKKALRANLSDLAAKGAEPLGFLLSLALNAKADEAWLAAFAKGLGADAAAYRCPLLGGDTDRTPGLLSVSISAFGQVPRGTMVKRSGARAGDKIVVTGTIGDAALGLLLRREPARSARASLTATERAHLAARYLLPEPRVALAATLREHASAALDVSDGLAGDLMKLAAASGVSARIEAARLPLSPGAQKLVAVERTLLETVLGGGDDYEILAAVAPAKVPDLRRAADAAGIALTEIGAAGAGEGVEIIGPDGRPLALSEPSFSHF
ncbi:MAG TPA: thiamine-phosphate kinase [Xanthobacteraceae bacterium]|nr:thiamine-phosphate kinase [Xanthobacteraceae bacterium]